ncbi:MAG: hypothetical protein JWM88_2031 [Verrucomicrobia bacterium]|nr:hypothetical protein [Verrucomicrobiota bacterium]
MKISRSPAAFVALFASGLAFVAPRALANEGHTGVDAKFQAMDTDGDGRISRAEHAAGAKKMFDEMDANHDGVVTADEMDARHERKSDGPAHAEMSAAEKIKVIDQDGDGKLTAAEHAAGSEAMFAKMDTDGDGYLTKTEMAAGHAMMKKDK